MGSPLLSNNENIQGHVSVILPNPLAKQLLSSTAGIFQRMNIQKLILKWYAFLPYVYE